MTPREETFRSEEGQTLVEYALIIGVVAMARSSRSACSAGR